MLRLRRGSAGVLCIPFLAAMSNQNALSVRAQNPDTTSPIQLVPRTKAQREQKYEAEHHISLLVKVTDLSDKPVNGLKADDFSVLDNQKPQKIERFREVDGKTFRADVHVLVVLDAINDGGSAVGHVKKDLDKFLSRGSGPLPFPFSLVFISSAGVLQTQPSTDRASIASRLAELARRPRDIECTLIEKLVPGMRAFSPQAGPRDAITQADCNYNHFRESINALRNLLGEKQNVRDRTILIWAGQGWPLGGLGNYPDVLVELNTDLRKGQVTLDAVSWSEFYVPKGFRSGITSVTASAPQTADQVAAAAMRLPVIARQNGGQAIAKVKNFGSAMSACLADRNDFYVLTFDSAPAATADEFHSIEVKVDRPGVNVRTASSYYAQP
ncbi:MAG TPA: VWA domain-containing protein [Edaphobacter sp.]|nr:VWA domain-containing protein [Edaphobacter sp.]